MNCKSHGAGDGLSVAGRGLIASKRMVGFVLGLILLPAELVADSRFSNYEIRVIRPRSFVKAGSVEVGGGLMNLSNQSFVYSVLGLLSATWHIDEVWGVEVQGAYGSSFDKADKTLLSDRFNINTIVLRTQSLINARINFTPAYGKVNLPDGDIVYFDTYMSLGAGTTGVRYTYDHCERPSDYPADVASRIPDPPSARTKSYSTGILGAGQRWFVGERSSVRVGVDFQRFLYAQGDGACTADVEVRALKSHDNVFLFFAWSKYL